MTMEHRGPGMGWLPDYPDFRDYTAEHEKINAMLVPTRVLKAGVKIPASIRI